MPEVKSLEPLLTAAQIDEKVTELARQIDRDYAGKDTIFLGILKGSYVFMADLARKVHLDQLEMCFMMVSSYGDATTTSGNVNIKLDLENDLTGKHVLIVEDIVDSGNTLAYLKSYLANRQAASVKICTILNKPSRRKTQLEPDYCGFAIPDAFVVGYGLDYAQKYRQLPDVCILHFEEEEAGAEGGKRI